MDEQYNNSESPVVWPIIERRKQSQACEDIHRLVSNLLDRVSTLERECKTLSTAFVKNDLDQPDLDGHRKAHKELVEASETLEGYKVAGAKSLIQAIVGFLFGIFTVGLFEWLKNPK